MSHFVWGGGALPLSEHRATQIPIKTVPKGVSHFHFLGTLCETIIHWNPAVGRRGRSFGHLEKDCPHCRDGISQRINGYAPALLWEDFWRSKGEKDPVHIQRWTPVVISCPETLTFNLKREKALAGRTFKLERESTSSPVIRYSLVEAAPLVPIPSVERFDIHPIVERVWGFRVVASPPAEVAPPTSAEPAKTMDESRADVQAQIQRLKSQNRKLREKLRAAEGTVPFTNGQQQGNGTAHTNGRRTKGGVS